MRTTYVSEEGHLRSRQEARAEDAMWIDLFEPSREEELRVEAELGLDLPTRDEMREVESSSTLYREHGATFVTIRMVTSSESQQARLTSVTMVLTDRVLVTIRYAEPPSMQQFVARTQKPDNLFHSAKAVLLCLLETVVDRDADLLESIGDTLEPISEQIFAQDATSPGHVASSDLSAVLKRIGSSGNLASRVRESLHSVGRSVPFLHLQTPEEELRVRLRTIERDVQSLLEHDNFVQTEIQFLLDSSVGFISIQQNAIMKTLSVAAVVFLPPTLIGSIYGMNFEHMPELHWRLGYLWALGLMVASALGPLVFFRAKRWL